MLLTKLTPHQQICLRYVLTQNLTPAARDQSQKRLLVHLKVVVAVSPQVVPFGDQRSVKNPIGVGAAI
jgi:hypothetical protein